MEEIEIQTTGSKNIPASHIKTMALKKKRKKQRIILSVSLTSIFCIIGIIGILIATKHEHDYVLERKASTCTENGYRIYTCECGDQFAVPDRNDPAAHKPGAEATCTTSQNCTVCNAELQAALGHTPGKDATCTEPSNCTVCGEILQTANGHLPGNAATCTKAQTCLVCKTELKAALGHTPKWEIITEATKTEDGFRIKNCTVCGVKFAEEIIPATGSIGLKFTFRGDGTYYVSGIGTCTDTDIIIPSAYNGMRVTSIGNSAFENCSGLTSIEIPDSVTSIGDSAFEYCTGLTSIEIPDSVTSIGNRAFYNCTKLTSVTIPDSVTSIGNGAFAWCTGLTSVTIPDSVTSIGNYAFRECTGLTSIEIPDSVTSIGNYAFGRCTGLTSITVDSNNPNYASIDGVLFNKAITKLICYPAGKTGTSYTIPDSVTIIDSNAFENCSGLTSVTIPDSVTSIGYSAFEDCSGLTSITIPDSVTSIGEWAFADCSGLTSITFNGTKAQWNAISKGSEWKYNVPATKVICSDGTVSLS